MSIKGVWHGRPARGRRPSVPIIGPSLPHTWHGRPARHLRLSHAGQIEEFLGIRRCGDVHGRDARATSSVQVQAN
jgi:hypothetical protein